MMSLNGAFQAKVKLGRPALGLRLIPALALSISACGVETTSPDDGPASSSESILEVNVSNNPDRGNGQPVVAVNPTDPDNLVLVSINHRSQTDDAPDRFHCFAAYSTDGGETWSEAPWPYGDRPMCGDPYLVVDSEGIFYVAFNRLGCPPGVSEPGTGNCDGVPNHLAVASSRDGGRTWSEPVDTPLQVGTTPRLRLDAATDRIYAVGGFRAPSPAGVSVSTDKGLTWTPMRALPAQPFSNQIAVHDGVLTTATSMMIVNERQVVSAEAQFWVSTDDGQTFASFPVTNSEGAPPAPPEGVLAPNPANGAEMSTDPVPWVSADPTQHGRFAIMIPRGDNLEVYLTNDSGKTWTGPNVIAAPGADKPWIEFGPTGNLGVMWRTKAVDAYSIVSCDGGKPFSAPMKVNQTTHPYASGGGEWSRILFYGQYVYVTWADGRTGGSADAIMARAPLSLYNC